MKRARIIIIFLVLSFLLTGCGRSPATTSTSATSSYPPRHSDLNFIFKFGVGAKNIMDTFQNKFTKDMITKASITTSLYLTDEDMDRIYDKMAEIDFFSYPDVFSVGVPAGKPTTIVTPYSSYSLSADYGGKNKKLYWDDQVLNPDAKADKLRGLMQFIIQIIESKPEFRKLPTPSGGYL